VPARHHGTATSRALFLFFGKDKVAMSRDFIVKVQEPFKCPIQDAASFVLYQFVSEIVNLLQIRALIVKKKNQAAFICPTSNSLACQAVHFGN
jgi:hypothetical protein